MVYYIVLVIYNLLLRHCADLGKQIRCTEPHSVSFRIRNGKKYYFERKFKNNKTIEFAIDKKKYSELKDENLKYRRMKKELGDTEKFIKKIEPFVPECNESVYKTYSAVASVPFVFTPKDEHDVFMPDKTSFKTLRGDIVRSKTEQSIADALFTGKYKYEYEPDIPELGFIPDFCIEDSIRGTPVIWEHFGLLNDFGYLSDALKKLSVYREHGYEVNKNLIITYELYSPVTGQCIIPFSSADIARIITEWFDPNYVKINFDIISRNS